MSEAEVSEVVLSGFQASSQGHWVAYTLGTTASSELYATASDGGPRVRISALDQRVWDFRISPQFVRVVYSASEPVSSLYRQLYSSDGVSAPVKINGPPVQFGGIDERPGAFRFTPDGHQVLYLASQSSVPTHLFRVPAGGGAAPIDLTPNPTRWVDSFALTGDGQNALLWGSYETAQKNEVFLVPIDGSAAPRRLSGDLPVNGDVPAADAFRLSPDESTLVYRADALVDERFELYAVGLALGSVPVHLNAPLSGRPGVRSFVIAPDGSGVVYQVQDQLYAVPIDGSAPAVLLSGPGTSASVYGIAPDSTRVVYRSDLLPQELYSVPLDGLQPPTLLCAPSGPHGVRSFEITPDSSQVLFVADLDALDELYGVPLDGSAAPVKRSAGGRVSAFRLSPDGSEVAFLAAQPRPELFAAPVDGSAAPRRLSPPPLAGSAVLGDFLVHAGGRVFFRGNLATQAASDLFVVPLDASQPARVLNDPLPTTPVTSGVRAFKLAPDGASVVYSGAGGVHALPLQGAGERRRLDGGLLSPEMAPPLALFETPSWIAFGPDSEQVFFSSFSTGQNLFGAPVDGTAPPIGLSEGSIRWSWLLSSVRVSPDGRSVACTSFDSNMYNPASGLVVGPADGGRASVRVGGSYSDSLQYEFGTRFALRDGSLGDGSLRSTAWDGTDSVSLTSLDVESFRLVDDDHVVFLASPPSTGYPTELHSVPTDGRAAPTLLASSVANGRVERFMLTPDHSQVLYLTGYGSGFAFWRVPVDGSQPAELVVGSVLVGLEEFVPLTDGEPFVLTADGSQLVYAAFSPSANRKRIFRVPMDGSGLAEPLTDPFVPNAATPQLFLAPTGTHVVYRSNSEVFAHSELFSIPLAGGAVVRLSGSPASHPTVFQTVRFLERSPGVLFLVDPSESGQQELFLAPLDGSVPARRVSGELLTPGSDVLTDFQLSPDEHWVYYRADQETDELVELYRAPLLPLTRRADPPRPVR